MPSTVSGLMSAVGLEPSGVVPWGAPVPEVSTGVYVVSLTESTKSTNEALPYAPTDKSTLDDLLNACGRLTLDSIPQPRPRDIADRMVRYWLPDEVVLYIGLAGQPLRTRVRQYYKTPIGAAKPHKGGWWLKTLSILPDLYVHYAVTPDFKEAEEEMMRTFARNISASSKGDWPSGEPIMPFANLRDGDWRRRNHGIKGATALPSSKGASSAMPQGETATPTTAASSARPSRTAPATPVPPGVTPHHRSQNVTAKDIEVGQVRIPGPTKPVFPGERGDIDVNLRGRELKCRWNPRNGPPERSGTLRVGKVAAAELLSPGDVLSVAATDDGVIGLT